MRSVQVTYTCDLCPKAKKKPLEEGEVFSLRFQHGNRTLETDLCQEHGQALVNNAQPVQHQNPSAGSSGRQRQQSEQLVPKEDYPAVRHWLAGQGLAKADSKGRIKREYQKAWIDAGRPQLPA